MKARLSGGGIEGQVSLRWKALACAREPKMTRETKR